MLSGKEKRRPNYVSLWPEKMICNVLPFIYLVWSNLLMIPTCTWSHTYIYDYTTWINYCTPFFSTQKYMISTFTKSMRAKHSIAYIHAGLFESKISVVCVCYFYKSFIFFILVNGLFFLQNNFGFLLLGNNIWELVLFYFHLCFYPVKHLFFFSFNLNYYFKIR